MCVKYAHTHTYGHIQSLPNSKHTRGHLYTLFWDPFPSTELMHKSIYCLQLKNSKITRAVERLTINFFNRVNSTISYFNRALTR